IGPSWRASELSTVVATACGLAPGNVAWTEMVGKSACGSGDTGSLKNATAPAAASPKVSNVVAIGRRMKGGDGPIIQFTIQFDTQFNSFAVPASRVRPANRIASRSNQR